MTSQADNAAFLESLKHSNRTALRIQAVCGALGQPFFAILDYYYIPAEFQIFVTLRLLCIVFYIVVLAATYTQWIRPYINLMGACIGWVTGWVIAIMVLYDTGPSSGYYAGLNIPIIAVGLLMTWNWKWNLFMSMPIYFSYLIPNLFHPQIYTTKLSDFVAHNFFILFTIIFITIAQQVNVWRKRDTFFANLALSRAKTALEKAHSQLQELDRVKSQFFANITHELRTPLTLILTPVDAIIEGELGDFQQHQLTYFRSIRQNGLRLLKLINDLLELSKLEDSQVRLRIEPVEIQTFFKSIFEIVKGMAERKQITLTLDGSDISVWIDRLHMERVFLNILANALKFTPNQGTIEVRVIEKQELIQIEVEDSGIGVPEEHLNQIFERFFQSDASSTRQYGGTGIGLSLVKELVNLHGGEIHAESTEGSGTTIIIELQKGREHFREEILDRRQIHQTGQPNRRTEDAGVSEWTHQLVDQKNFRYLDIDMATERRVVPREEHDFKEARLLIVEDNIELLRFLNTLLGETYDIFTAMDGGTAFERAKEKKPDLILSDVMLPVMDGFELCKKLKKDPDTMHIPIILLTARTKAEDLIAGLEHGADSYLTKPFSPRELRTRVRETLKNRAITAKMVLRKKLDAIQLMSARMAHEIYNPLNMIKNSLEAITMQLKHREDQEILKAVRPFMDIAGRAIPRIHDTVELMKHYSKEGYNPVLRSHNLTEAIEQILKVINIPPHKKCDIQFQEETKKPVWCDPAEFNQALLNIIENAVDSIEEEGSVTIRLFESKGDIVISVKDTGCGIAPEELDRIFSPFYTTKGPGKGMGLGMTISFQAIESQGGSMEVSSQLGVGTHMIVRMPGEPGRGLKAEGRTKSQEP